MSRWTLRCKEDRQTQASGYRYSRTVVTNEPMKELADGRYRLSLPLPENNTNTYKVLTSNTSLIADGQHNGTSYRRRYILEARVAWWKVAVVLNSGKVSNSQKCIRHTVYGRTK